jgi:hypothetical protein
MRRFAILLLPALVLSPAAQASNIPDSYWAEPLPTAMYAATIRDIQSKLKELNCYRGAIDGLAGRGTTGGIKAWQKANNAPQNGIVSEPLMQSLLNAQSVPCKR